jgi:hypothetical protein
VDCKAALSLSKRHTQSRKLEISRGIADDVLGALVQRITGEA